MCAMLNELRSVPAELVIREFQPGDEVAFRRLNEEWITQFFRMEAKDERMLADPRANILEHGGRIFFALVGNKCVGCCALIRMDRGEFEVAKMGVMAGHQRSGIGRRLLQAVIDTARASGAGRLYLETNHALTPAIRLYESLGFRHLPPQRVPISPYARADVYMELLFE
jgi:GNAT superfamily N-acetyltransferase